jgi:conjugative relaxase-like TrwC/TraI family protein
MLRVYQNQSVADAKKYFSKSAGEYYVDGQQELRGYWRGEGAKMLGLNGEITHVQWNAICDGFNPVSGEKLVQRLKANRTVGYDFTFSTGGKSVSILYNMTQDERILKAFRESVNETMRDIESEVQARVRKDGKNEDRRVGNLVWGEFVHLTARPLDDGIPDCQLHAHCFALNVVKDPVEGVWKAGQFRDLKRDAPYFQELFHAKFARTLAELGLPIERTRDGFEIAGFSRELVDRFSRRTSLIEAVAKAKGITDPAAKAELGAKTRNNKAADLTMPELRAIWRSRMTTSESGTIERLKQRIGGRGVSIEPRAAEIAVKYAVDHSFERRSCVPERRILAAALKRAVGAATPEQVVQQMDRGGLIVGERNGQRMATTHEVLDEEMRMLDWCRRGRGSVPTLGKPSRKLKREWLNESQRRGVRHILESHDRTVMLRGAAGVGKSTLMSEVVEAITENGGRVLPLAPTAEASRGVLRAEGFTDADTLANLIASPALQRQAQGAVLWIDEAGLIGSRTMATVCELADRLDCRIILTGDKRQNPSVERGSVLHLLETEAGIKPAEVREIQRQKERYKEAVKLLSEGRSTAGFDKLDELGWIREIADDKDRYAELARDYVDTIASGKECLVVCPTHAEGKQLVTAEIRRQLTERSRLGDDRRKFEVLQNANLTEAQRSYELSYCPTDVLEFHRSGKGFRRGQRVKVGAGPLPLEQAGRFTVFRSRELELATGDVIRVTHNGWSKNGLHRLNNGSIYTIRSFTKSGDIVLNNGWVVAKDFSHFDFGYCITSYAAQGKTVKHRVLVAQGNMSLPATSKESFYVAASRAKESVAVYCADKEALREAISESDERLSATELVNQARVRAIVELHRRLTRLNHDPVVTRERELVHER